MTKKIAVIGHPISHSLSPKLHNYWINNENYKDKIIEKLVDAVEYVPLDVKPEDLLKTIKQMQKDGYIGCNVTIPHKEAMLDIVDYMSDKARRIGAINTVVFQDDGKIDGYNTDAYGFTQNIKTYPIKALVLGAGGASRAVCDGLLELECKIILVNRTKEKAENLANDFPNIKVVYWEEKENYLSDIDLLVNTTSLGMVGQPELEIDLSTLNKNALVTEIIYKPLKTNLLKQAEARGNPTVDGLGMLLYQAQNSFEIWFGIKPEVNQELRDYILENME